MGGRPQLGKRLPTASTFIPYRVHAAVPDAGVGPLTFPVTFAPAATKSAGTAVAPRATLAGSLSKSNSASLMGATTLIGAADVTVPLGPVTVAVYEPGARARPSTEICTRAGFVRTRHLTRADAASASTAVLRRARAERATIVVLAAFMTDLLSVYE
jgi:hypothetical protein